MTQTATKIGRVMDKIFVKDIELDMFIGVFEHEKTVPQKVRVSIEAYVEPNSDWESDDINQTVSYDQFVQATQDIASTGHIDLVETYAERIAGRCLDNERIKSVTVCVEKPEIYSFARSAGVEITRNR